MKITRFGFLFGLLFCCAGFSTNDFLKSKAGKAHPFYVSVTQVDENAKQKILEISCKIFTDDFEKTLRMHYKGTVDLLNPANKQAMNGLISDYIEKHFKIWVDGKPVSLEFVGYEKDEEAVECYFQVNAVSVNKSISIFNNLLFEYKPEQTNIVHVTVKGKRKSRQLSNPDSRINFDF